MFIINITYQVEIDLIDKYLQQHRAWLDKYYSEGKFIISGRKIPRNGGIIIAKGHDLENINAIINEDPFKLHQLANYEILEIDVTRVAEILKFLRID